MGRRADDAAEGGPGWEEQGGECGWGEELVKGEGGRHDQGVEVEPPEPGRGRVGREGGLEDGNLGPVRGRGVGDGEGGDVGPEEVVACEGGGGSALVDGEASQLWDREVGEQRTMTVGVGGPVAEDLLLKVWQLANAAAVVAGDDDDDVGAAAGNAGGQGPQGEDGEPGEDGAEDAEGREGE